MRRKFSDELFKQMQLHPNIYLLVGDLGYHVFDEHFISFPERCINCGAAEQTMLDMAVGLALDGKIPFCYSITPFLIYRPFETLHLYLHGEKIPVKLIGSGRDKDYMHDGPSHDASSVEGVLNTCSQIIQYYPEKEIEIPMIVEEMIENDKPCFLSLQR